MYTSLILLPLLTLLSSLGELCQGLYGFVTDLIGQLLGMQETEDSLEAWIINCTLPQQSDLGKGNEGSLNETTNGLKIRLPTSSVVVVSLQTNTSSWVGRGRATSSLSMYMASAVLNTFSASDKQSIKLLQGFIGLIFFL